MDSVAIETKSIPKRVGTYVGKDRTRSVSGLEVSVLKSVIQKLFRYRYDDVRVAQAFYELVTATRACTVAKKPPQAKAHSTWLVNRLFVIFCEDIGAAAPETIFWVHECANKLRDNPEDVIAVKTLASLLLEKRRNRDLSYLRYALFTSPRIYKTKANTASEVYSSSSSSSSSSSLPSSSKEVTPKIEEGAEEEEEEMVIVPPTLIGKFVAGLKADLLAKKPQGVEGLKALMNIMWKGLEYDKRKSFWKTKKLKISNKIADQLFEILSNHRNRTFVGLCKQGYRGLSAGHSDGWLFFAIACYVVSFPFDLNQEKELRREFHRKYNEQPKDLLVLYETDAFGPFEIPKESFDVHVGKSLSSKHLGSAATSSMEFSAAAFRKTIEVLFHEHETTFLPDSYRLAYCRMIEFREDLTEEQADLMAANPVSVAPKTVVTLKRRTREEISAPEDHTKEEMIVEGEPPKKRHSPEATSSSSSSSSSMVDDASEAVPSGVRKWSHSILEGWLEDPWVGPETARAFVESLKLPGTRQKVIQATKAVTSIYTFEDGSSIFIKGPSTKKHYRSRFVCQWLASALKSVVADEILLPQVPSRIIEHEGSFYLLMHDVNHGFNGAFKNVKYWLEDVKITSIAEMRFDLRMRLFATLIFRNTFAIGDTNVRNIMTNGNLVYSIDEESGFCTETSKCIGDTLAKGLLFSQLPAGVKDFIADLKREFSAAGKGNVTTKAQIREFATKIEDILTTGKAEGLFSKAKADLDLDPAKFLARIRLLVSKFLSSSPSSSC